MLWIFDPSNVQGRACSRFWIKTDVINKFWKLQITNGQKAFSLSLSLPDIMNLVLSKEIRSTQSPEQCGIKQPTGKMVGVQSTLGSVIRGVLRKDSKRK